MRRPLTLHCQNLPLTSRPYVSAVTTNGVSISGAPTTLDKFLSSLEMASRKSLKVPIRGPYHSASAYSAADIEAIVSKTLSGLYLLDSKPQTPILSCATGAFTTETTFGDLLRTFTTDILTRPIRFDKLFASLTELVSSSRGSTIFVPINAQVPQSVTASLKGKDVVVDRSANAVAQQPEQKQPKVIDENDAKIAIIGYSGRFPEADGLDEFWDLMQQGLDVVKEVPSNRWDPDSHYDATLKTKNTSRVKHGCWLKNPGDFDAKFFHISPREAAQTDPAQRIALLTAYEAVEMAGLVPDRTPSTQRHRVGVYYGCTSDDWREINNAQDIDTYFIPGGIRAFIPGRINYHFKFSGPSFAVDTACSSSLAAINIAMNSLLKRDCDTAIAGGTNILTNPDNFAGLDRGHFLSPTGNCATFDDGANGYCRAEGVGTVILKRLSDALADKDPVFGVILGAHTNHSADAVSITRPLSDAQEYLFKKLLRESGVNPHDVSFIEMHGTGTQAGDAVEMTSVLNTFAWDYSRPSNKSLHLGSVKSNIGHGESASGVMAMIKVLLMMKHGRIPVHSGIKTKINHGFPTDLDRRGVFIPMTEKDWSRPVDGKRRAFVNNFSAAGGNTSLLMEDGPLVEDVTESEAGIEVDSRGHLVVNVSARSVAALQKNLVALANSIDAETTSLPRLSYTTTSRRIHHPRRVSIVATHLQGLKKSLLDAAANANDVRAIPAIPAKEKGTGFLFTGQGAQYTAMAQGLYSKIAAFKADVDAFNGIAQSQGLPSMIALVDGSVDIEKLSPTVVQMGTCIVQMALARFWMNLGLTPSYVVGHSLGEYAAMHIAGILSASDAIYLCGYRASLLEKKCTPGTHGMVAVKVGEEQLHEVIAGTGVEVACVNGPDDTVLSGKNSDIDAVREKLASFGCKFTKLVLPFAFHSSQVEPILDELEAAAKPIEFKAPRIPFVSTVIGDVVDTDGLVGASYLRRHCREPVNFLGAIEAAQAAKLLVSNSIAVEIGGHPILSRLVKTIPGVDLLACVQSLKRGEDNFKTLAESLRDVYLAGATLKWDTYHADFAAAQQVLPLPFYAWDLDTYWRQYEGNWCVTKADAASMAKLASASAPAASTFAVSAPPPKPIRLSTSVHEVIEEVLGDKQSFIIGQSDVFDPEMFPVANEHRVNGLILTPSGLYGDVAYTLATHLVHKKLRKDTKLVADVCDMVVEKGLILKESGPQCFRAALTIDWDSCRGNMELYSVDDKGTKTQLHATCSVQITDPQTWEDDWQQNLYLVQRSIDHLVHSKSESVHKVRRGMAYKLFSAAVEYGETYRGMDEVHFDSQHLEATAKVQLQQTKGKYMLNPFWFDSLGHLTGYTMHSNDCLDLKQFAYLNRGWKYTRLAEPLDPKHEYRTYVKMQSVKGGDDTSSFAGDLYILRDGRIVGKLGGVTFNRVPHKVFQMLLPKKVSGPSPVSAPIKPVVAAAAAAASPAKKAKQPKSPKPSSAKPKPTPPVMSLAQRAIQLICDEIGIDPAKLNNDDDAEFADFGVDSLMTLTILGNFREVLDLDVPSSFFDDCPSVRSMKEYLSANASGAESTDGSWSAVDTEFSDDTESSSVNGDDEEADKNEKPTTAQAPGVAVDSVDATISFLLAIMEEETGVSKKDLTKADDLADLGIDSLVSLTVLGRAREELSVDLPNDMFMQHVNVPDIKTALREILGVPEPAPAPVKQQQQKQTPSASAKPAKSVAPSSASVAPKLEPVPTTLNHPQATSLILQGGKSSTTTLFLFPDGSGSSTSYVGIPSIGKSIRVYGLNCPYIKKPTELKCALQDLTDSYLAEIRRRQPKGPYTLAGWSAGGIAAFDAAQRLRNQGEKVDKLILLDCPNPIGLEKLPPRFYKFLETAGAFGNDATPEWLVQHFESFNEALQKYVPRPFEPMSEAPRTHIIWAKDGLLKNNPGLDLAPQPGDPREMRWLLDNRGQNVLGPNQWDTLVGADKISVDVVEGANHFNLVREPASARLASVMGKILG